MATFFSAGNWSWSLLLPFVVAGVAAGLTRLIGGAGRGAAMSGLAISAGFVAAWLLLRSLPDLPPRSLLEHVPLVAVAGALLGVLAVALSVRRGALQAIIIAATLLALWLALGRPLGFDWRSGLRAAALLAAWLVVLLRLESRPTQEPVAAMMLVMLAIGIGAAAWFAGDAAGARLGFALAAAAAGFLAWNWFLGLPFLAPALLGGGGAALSLATAHALAGRTSIFALAALLLIAFADGTANRLPAGSGLARKLLRPLLLGLVCLLPVALAAIVAHVAAQMPSR